MTIKIYSIYNTKTKADIRGSRNDLCRLSGLTLEELDAFYLLQADADINNMPTKIQSDFKVPANAIRIKRKPRGFAKV